MVMHAPSDERAERESWVRRRAAQTREAQPASLSHAYAATLENVSDAVAIVDRRGMLEYVNPALEALLGEARATLLGRPWWSFTSPVPPRQNLVPRVAVRALANQAAWHTRLQVRPKAGVPVVLDVQLTRVSDAEGHLPHFCAVARVPSSERSSELLETVGRLSAEIAHDFNNQIAVVLNYAFILLRQLPADSGLHEHVRQVQAAAWRASQVAQEMVSFGAQRSSEPEILDINQVAAGMGDVLAHALRQNVKLELRPGANLLPIRTRLPHVEWLLLELALHARLLLGGVARFVIETRNEEGSAELQSSLQNSSKTSAETKKQPNDQRYVVLTVHAEPAADGGAEAMLAPIRSPFTASHFPENAAALPGAEVAVLRANGSISTTRQPDGGVTYEVRLPALTQ